MGRGGWLRGRCGGGKGGKALRNFKELWSDMGALGGLGGLGRARCKVVIFRGLGGLLWGKVTSSMLLCKYFEVFNIGLTQNH